MTTRDRDPASLMSINDCTRLKRAKEIVVPVQLRTTAAQLEALGHVQDDG